MLILSVKFYENITKTVVVCVTNLDRETKVPGAETCDHFCEIL